MKIARMSLRAVTGVLLGLIALAAAAADYPAPKEGDWIARDFRFHTGEVMPELRLHYTTIGAPTGEPVLVLHGTAGSGASMLTGDFAGELFGPASRSTRADTTSSCPTRSAPGSRPSPPTACARNFRTTTTTTWSQAQYRLVTEGLGVKPPAPGDRQLDGRHARLDVGRATTRTSWTRWCRWRRQPTAMAGRNWMMRRMLIEPIRNDPGLEGRQLHHPAARAAGRQRVLRHRHQRRHAGLSQGRRRRREKADKLLDERLAAPFTADANDFLYQWESSRDYNPSPGLERIRAALLAINSADDERNPPELGIMERELKRVKNGRLYLIPASEDTRGHGTTGMAKLWKQQLQELLQTTPRRIAD